MAFEPRLAENAVAINPVASKPTKFASRRGENYRERYDQSPKKRSHFEVKNYERNKVVKIFHKIIYFIYFFQFCLIKADKFFIPYIFLNIYIFLYCIKLCIISQFPSYRYNIALVSCKDFSLLSLFCSGYISVSGSFEGTGG